MVRTPRAVVPGLLAVTSLASAAPLTAVAQGVECRAAPARDGTVAGRCVQGDSVVGEIAFRPPQQPALHLWTGTIRGKRFTSAASSGPTGESEIGVDVRPGGALRIGRSWLALRNVTQDETGLGFSFHFDRSQRSTDVDVRILERARAVIADASSWNRADTTDMDAAPIKGFGCAPATRQSMFCAVYVASLEVAGDYAHFRPAVNAVRQAVGAVGRSYRHPLLGFNNDTLTSLRDVHGILSTAVAAVRQDAANCDRPCLEGLAEDYLAALVAHNPSQLPVAAQVRFTENGTTLQLGEGLWRSASSLGRYRVYVTEPDSHAVAVQAVLHGASTAVQLLVRLKAPGGRITEIETLVARQGDTCCWDVGRLESLSAVFERPLPAAARATREDMVAIADDYFTALHTSGTPSYRRARMLREMIRYENGMATTNVPGGGRLLGADAMTQLDSAMFGPIRVVDRRYPVVDLVHGSLLAIVIFESPNPARTPTVISEFFKIVNGEIHEIRAVMVGGRTVGWP